MGSWVWSSYHKAQALIAPGAGSCQDRYAEALLDYLPPGAHWLDVGCGWQALRPWLATQEQELVERSALMIGLDPEWEAVGRNESISAGVAGFGNALPFEDETFDFVSANMVVEHLEHPLVDFAEIRRVLRPGGRFVFLTPNANGYLVRLASPIPHAVRELLVKIVEDRDAEDHFPTHYRANTEAEIQEVAEAAGMELTECRHVLSAAEFARFLPLAVIELAWLRFISRPGREDYRPNLVAILTRPES